MSILFVSPDIYGYGGVQLFSRLAMQAIREEFGQTHGVTVLSRMDSPDAMTAEGPEPVIACSGNLGRFTTAYIRLINRQRWDAVIMMHAHHVRLNFMKFRPQKMAVILHGIEVWKKLSPTYRWTFKGIDRIISNSQHTIRKACTYNPWLSRIPTSVCHLGVHTPEEQPVPVRTDERYVLCVGRMVEAERYKGFDELISIWPRVEAACPGMKLKLMGDGPDRPRLEALARASGAGIEFLGRVSDAERDCIMMNCSAFAMPSRAEGFGLVYLEAMRVGRPVLTGNNDAGCEVIEDKVSGRAVNPIQPDQLLEGLLDVLGPNGERYGVAGRTRFYEHFTYSHFKLRFVNEIRNLISSP